MADNTNLETPGEKLDDAEVDVSGGGAMGLASLAGVARSMNGAGAAPDTEGAGEFPPGGAPALAEAEGE